MGFAPLKYAYESITVWHFAVLAVFMTPAVWGYFSGTANEKAISSTFSGVIFSLFFLCWAYCLVAPILGQVFGEKFTFSMVWRSSVALGVSWATAFVWFSWVRHDSILTAEKVALAMFAFVFFSAFLSLALNLFLWLLPRMVDLNPFSLPKYPWGVQLP